VRKPAAGSAAAAAAAAGKEKQQPEGGGKVEIRASSTAAEAPPPSSSVAAAAARDASKRPSPSSASPVPLGTTAAATAATPSAAALAAEDPTAYELELARREAELGPEHPRVADALSALAAVLAARGERVAAARSLERALAVYEKAAAGGSGGDETRSPSSSPSDVAAALTDLAVLHLEAGRDELGKPLLRRALEIQRRALGDSHPDVVAIRDVLEAE